METLIKNLLASLPSEPDEIASRLAQEECWGGSEPTTCPLHVWFLKQAGYDVRVTPSYVRAKQSFEDDGTVIYHTLQGVKSFVIQHDQGHYPFLWRDSRVG